MISVAAPCRCPIEPPVPCASAILQLGHLHLGMRLAAELTHRFDDFGHAAAVRGVVVAEPAAVGVERELAGAGNEVAVRHELSAFALLAEPEVLDLQEDRDGEAVVNRRVLDVAGLHARFLERARARPRRARVGEIDFAAHLVLRRFSRPDEFHERPLQAFRDLRPRHDHRAAAVAHDAAVEAMQRIRDHRRVHDFLDRDHVPEHRVGVVLGVMRSRDFDPGELLARRAVLVHVAHRAHRVEVHGHRAVRHLVRRIGKVDAAVAHLRAGAAFGVRPAGERDQRDVALSGRDGFRGVGDVHQIRAAAHVGGVDVAQLVEVHVVRHAPDVGARRVTRTEVAVDVVLGESRVLERAFRALRVELRDGFVGGLAQGMLESTGDVGFAFDGHV